MNRKKILSLVAGTLILTGASTATSFIINGSKLTNDSSNNSLEQTSLVSNDFESSNTKEEQVSPRFTSDLYMDGTNVVNADNSINIVGNETWIPVNTLGTSNHYTTVAAGNDIITIAKLQDNENNYGVMRIDGSTGKVKWVTNFKRIVHQVMFMENYNTVVVLSQEVGEDKKIKVTTLDAENGDWKRDPVHNWTTRWIDMTAGTVKDCFLLPWGGANDAIAVGNRAFMSSDQRKSSSFKFVFNNDGTIKDWYKMEWIDDNTTDQSSVVGMSVLWHGNKNYIFQLLKYKGNNGTVYLKMWNWGGNTTNNNTARYEQPYSLSISDDLIQNSNAYSGMTPNIYTLNWGSGEYALAAVVQNAYGDYQQHNHTKILWLMGSDTTNTGHGTVDLDTTNHDYDLDYMDFTYDFAHSTYKSYSTGVLTNGDIVQFRMDNWSSTGSEFTTEDSWTWSGNNTNADRVKIYKQPPERNSVRAVQLKNSNIAWLSNDAGRYLWEIKSEGLGSWAYNSVLLASSLMLENADSESAWWVKDSALKKYAKNADLLSQINYRSSDSAITSITKDDSTTYNDVYQGRGNFNVEVSNVFTNGTKGPQSYKFRFEGFHLYETKVRKTEQDISAVDGLKDQLASTVSNQDIINYLYSEANRESFFFDLPLDFQQSYISIENPIDNDVTGTKSFDIVLQQYVGDDHTLKTDSFFKHRFTMNGFQIGQTGIKQEIDVNELWPNDHTTTPAQVNENGIRDALFTNQDSLFINKPETIDKSNITDITFSNIKQNEGTIDVQFKLTNSLPTPGKILNFKLVGLQNTVTNLNQSTITVSGTDKTSLNVTDEELKDIVRANLSNMLTGTPEGYDPNNEQIVFSEWNRNQNGESLSVKVTFKNVYTNSGYGEFEHTFTFIGFNGKKTELAQNSFSFDELSGKNANEYTTSTIQEVITRNLGDILVNGPENNDGVTVNVTNWSPNERGTEGTVNVTFGNVYGYDNGQFVTSFTITGFAGYVTEINISNEENWGDEGVYAKDRANDESIKELLIGKLKQISTHLPKDWDSASKLLVKVNSHDNQHGTINVTATFNDVYGNTSNGLTSIEKTFTIKGYRLMETTVKDGGTFSFGSKNKLASSDANDTAIKNILSTRFNEMFDNIPDGFKQADVSQYTIDRIEHHDNLGRLEFDLTVSGVYGPDLKDELTQHIVFNGYQSEVTDWKGSSFKYGDDTLWASDPKVNNNDWVTSKVKEHITDMVQGLPVNWEKETPDNIVVSDLKPNDKEGKLVFHLRLNNVFAQDKQNFIEKDITFYGFMIPETKWKQESGNFSIGNDQVFAKEAATPEKIQETIIQNIDEVIIDKPKDFKPSTSNIQIMSDPVVDNAAGTITCTVKISDVFGKNNSNFIEKEITISGYKAEKTSWKSNLTLDVGSQYGGKPASAAAKDEAWIKRMVGDNLTSLVNNLPDQYDRNNISIQGTPTPNDPEGKLVVRIKLSNIYGTPNYIENDITITGFSARSTSFTNETTFNVNMPNINPESFSDSEIKDYIFKNKEAFVSNLPDNFNSTGLSIENVVKSNANGNIKLKLVITSTLQGETISKDITLIGFKQTNTSLKTNVPIGNGSMYVTDESLTKEYIKDFVEKNIHKFASGLPNNYDPTGNVTITSELDRNVEQGTISFDLQLTGVNSNDKTISGRVTISGYKTTGITTTIEKTPTVSNQDKLPSELSIDDIKQQIIKDNLITNTFNGQPISPKDLDVEIISYDNQTGEVKVKVTLLNGGWENGNPKEIYFGEIIIGGFKSEAAKFNWWIWVVICSASLLLILLIILIILLIKKRKAKEEKLSAIAPPPRPVSQQLTHSPQQVVSRPIAPKPQNGAAPNRTTTTTRVVKQVQKAPTSGQISPTSTTTKRVVTKK